MNLWRRWGILVVAAAFFGAAGAWVVLGGGTDSRSREGGSPGVMSYRDIIRSRQGPGGDRPARRGPLACAAGFQGESALYEQEAKAKRAAAMAGPPRPVLSTEEVVRAIDERNASIARMSLDDLLDAAAPYEIASVVFDRVEAKRSAGQPVSASEALMDPLMTLKVQVGNGGFHQYFFNSSGDRAMEARRALGELRHAKLEAIFDCALTAFDNDVAPEDFVERDAQLEAWGDDQFEIFDELDSAFHRLEDEFLEAMVRIVRERRGEFDLPPTAPASALSDGTGETTQP